LKTIRILGHPYTVEYVDDWQDPLGCAKCESQLLQIKIDGSMPESRIEEALLHEIIEAINYHLEIELEHNKLTAISEVLYGVIKDNKLFEKGKK
jgi:hypothetical protein